MKTSAGSIGPLQIRRLLSSPSCSLIVSSTIERWYASRRPVILPRPLTLRWPSAVSAQSSLQRAWIPSWTANVAAEVLTDGAFGDDQLSVSQLDVADGVITGCAVAIAETGTLVLDGSPDQGRRVLTLIPDYHLCVVFPHQIVADVPQALARLEATRPLTMISGPSATSDIELNRVEGVHGPRTLEVIIVQNAR